MAVQISRNSHLDMHEVAVAPTARVLVSQVVGGDGMPTTMGAGFTRYSGEWDYFLNYDVTYYMIEGSLTILWEGESYTAEPGDVVFMSRGMNIHYDATRGGCMIFWVAYPGNWQELTDLPS